MSYSDRVTPRTSTSLSFGPYSADTQKKSLKFDDTSEKTAHVAPSTILSPTKESQSDYDDDSDDYIPDETVNLNLSKKRKSATSEESEETDTELTKRPQTKKERTLSN